MKLADIVIGQNYLTKISNKLTEVRVESVVTAALDPHVRGPRIAFRCVRVDTGKTLPRARSAQALHPLDTPRPRKR